MAGSEKDQTITFTVDETPYYETETIQAKVIHHNYSNEPGIKEFVMKCEPANFTNDPWGNGDK